MSSRRSRTLTGPERPRGRWRRPAWKDPRMAGGVVLVAGAVALGAWAVDAAADTTRVYVLSQDVAPGTDLTADGILTVVEAHPGTDAYVEAGYLPDGAVSTRSMRKGELLAAAAVNSGREQELRPVVLTVASCPRRAWRVGPRRRRLPPGRVDRVGREVKATRRGRPRGLGPAAWPQGWSSPQSVRPARG